MNQFIFDVLLLVWLHFVADFVMQSDRVARGKSSSNLILLQHIILYGIPFCLFFGIKYAVLNSILHFMVDWNTSRATSFLWAHKKVHWFFVVIGLDQALHMSCLFITYAYLFA